VRREMTGQEKGESTKQENQQHDRVAEGQGIILKRKQAIQGKVKGCPELEGGVDTVHGKGGSFQIRRAKGVAV